MFDVSVEPFRPEEDVGLFHQEKCRQLSSGLLHSYFIQELRLSLLQEQAERGSEGELRTLQQTSPEDGQIKTELQSLQPQPPPPRQVQEREDCAVLGLPSQDSVKQQLQLVMKVERD